MHAGRSFGHFTCGMQAIAWQLAVNTCEDSKISIEQRPGSKAGTTGRAQVPLQQCW